MVSWPYVCRHITECSYPPPPLPRCELLCSDVLISYYRAPSCTNRRSLSYQSHSIWHSGTDLISQHLILTSVTASRTDLAASRAIDSHHVSHQSPQHLVPISQHLAPISQHLVPRCESRSRTDLPPSGPISRHHLHRSCSSTILQHFYRQVAEQASAVIAAATATAAASVGSLAGAAVACGDGCKLCFLAPRNMKLKTIPCVLA